MEIISAVVVNSNGDGEEDIKEHKVKDKKSGLVHSLHTIDQEMEGFVATPLGSNSCDEDNEAAATIATVAAREPSAASDYDDDCKDDEIANDVVCYVYDDVYATIVDVDDDKYNEDDDEG